VKLFLIASTFGEFSFVVCYFELLPLALQFFDSFTVPRVYSFFVVC